MIAGRLLAFETERRKTSARRPNSLSNPAFFFISVSTIHASEQLADPSLGRLQLDSAPACLELPRTFRMKSLCHARSPGRLYLTLRRASFTEGAIFQAALELRVADGMAKTTLERRSFL